MEIHMCDVSGAVKHYNKTLLSGVKQSDKHMDGFLKMMKIEFSQMNVKEKHKAILSGGILNKRWDILATDKNRTFAVEFKSILSSRFGRNYSSRVEEAIGVGFDARAKNRRVKLGYIIVLENDDNNGFRFYNKINNFCNSIVQNYKIYNSALAIEINGDEWNYLYNDYETFVKELKHKTIFDLLGI
jgi:hypothetical protein